MKAERNSAKHGVMLLSLNKEKSRWVYSIHLETDLPLFERTNKNSIKRHVIRKYKTHYFVRGREKLTKRFNIYAPEKLISIGELWSESANL